jgi:hypothetical protein
MAATAAAPPDAGAGERLAAALQGLGDALSLEAQAGLMPEEVQERVGSWGARTQALVGAATEDGVQQEAEAAAAAQLLQPLLDEGFVADYPDLFTKALEVDETFALCCSDEVGAGQRRCASRAHHKCPALLGSNWCGWPQPPTAQ